MRNAWLVLCLMAPLAAQSGPPDLSGTWQLEKANVKGDGPRTVVIRSDSSASWGKETVRWRLRGESILIAIGGEWETYRLRVGKGQLTLSGGDLSGPIVLKRAGPATPRPAGVAVPPDPDLEPPRA
ncbi:MAG: hypothetical protein ACRENB_08925 [Gemmatimonadales bacterium]